MVDSPSPPARVGRRDCSPDSGGGFGNTLNGQVNDNVLNSQAVQSSFNKYGDYFLSQAFPEGSPTHPAYPTGHGAVAGACITVLKFFFDGNFVIPNPMVATNDGLSLIPYTGADAAAHGQRRAEQTCEQRLFRARDSFGDPLAQRHRRIHSTGGSRGHQHAAGSGGDLRREIHRQSDQDRRYRLRRFPTSRVPVCISAIRLPGLTDSI